MAGEWIPIDCNLGTKPEVLELVDETGVPVEVAVYRLIQLWSWASLNSSDGTIRATPSRIASAAGGDEQFWLAVERVGWVSFADGNVVISGWEKRFSNAAKARAMAARRQDTHRQRSRNGGALRVCNGAALPEERRGEEKREEIQQAAPAPATKPASPSRSPAKTRISWTADAGWTGIEDLDRQEWEAAYPGVVLDQELAKATAWLRANPKRCGKRNWRGFLVGWFGRCQDKGGTHREPGRRPEDKPPPKVWRDKYVAAPYRRPHEVAEVALAIKLKEEDT